MSTVKIPPVRRDAVGGRRELEVEGATVSEVLERLYADHPGVREQLMTPEGELHRFVNVYVNDEDVRFSGGLATAIADGDSVTILPAVAGG